MMERNTSPQKSLKVRGFYKGLQGYNHHLREVVKALLNQQIAVELQTPTPSSHHSEPSWLDTLSALPPHSPPAKTVLHIAMPHEAIPIPGILNILYTMFEATPAPASWVELSLRHDLIVVPTESSRQAWIAGGAPEERLRVCPLGIDANLFNQPVSPLPLLNPHDGKLEDKFQHRFLYIFAITPRKNVTGLLRTWIRATSTKDDAVLILKPGIYYPGDEQLLQGYAREAQSTAGKSLQEAAPIMLVPGQLKDEEMPSLYATATHYVSLSHGEGWDLPMIEAGAAGLQLIAPQNSAYTAYLNNETAHLIPCRPAPTRFIGSPYYSKLFEGATWWDPDEEKARQLIYDIIHHQAESKKSPREQILKDFSWEQSIRRLLEIINELENNKAP